MKFHFHDISIKMEENWKGKYDECQREYKTLLREKKKIQKNLANFVKVATKDQLTQAFNFLGCRYYVFPALKKEIESRGNCSILAGDIDFFKNINDAISHQAGDTCLATYFKADMRVNDMEISRRGGDESERIFFENRLANVSVKQRERFDPYEPVRRVVQFVCEDFRELKEKRNIYYKNPTGLAERSKVPDNYVGKQVTATGGVFCLDEDRISAYFLLDKTGIKYLKKVQEEYRKYNSKGAFHEEKIPEFVNEITKSQIKQQVRKTQRFSSDIKDINDDLIFLFRGNLIQESNFLKGYFNGLANERNIFGLVKYIEESALTEMDERDDLFQIYVDTKKHQEEKKVFFLHGELTNHIKSNYNVDERFRQSLQDILVALNTSSGYGEKIFSGEIPIINKTFFDNNLGAEIYYDGIMRPIAFYRSEQAKLQGRNRVILNKDNMMPFTADF